MKSIAALSLLLMGCNTPIVPTAFNDRIDLRVKIDNNIIFKGEKADGLAIPAGRDCFLQLPSITYLEDSYNFCIWGKELFHCVYGYYHKGRKDDYC